MTIQLREWLRMIESIVEHDGDRYFERSNAELSDVHNDKSRSTLVYMTPADFLRVAEHGFDQQKQSNVDGLLKQGVKFRSLPTLSFFHDGQGVAQVVGHEGRHRARALQRLGVKQMPVILRSLASAEGKAIRWGSQHNPIDRVAVWPTVLKGEDGGGSIPMPRSVIFPA
jgi:hypothetical protein